MSKELIHSASFVKSSVETDKCPPPIYPEFAFIGRSNVGKSSLINMLVNKKGLAKTSASPGKTQTINHFIINEEKNPWYLVDLPGYGYAKTSKSERNKWGSFIRNYLDQRENLICTFVLLDFRIPPQKIDLEFMQWLGEQGLPLSRDPRRAQSEEHREVPDGQPRVHARADPRNGGNHPAEPAA